MTVLLETSHRIRLIIDSRIGWKEGADHTQSSGDAGK
jgi:hypothetical protein